MLKKLVFGVCMLTSLAATADAVFVADNEDKSKQWWAYVETITKMADGYSVMIGMRYTQERTPEERLYYGVMFSDCDKGHGTLYMRATQTSDWSNDTIVSMAQPRTVADAIASEICNVYKKFGKSGKAPAKKLIKLHHNYALLSQLVEEVDLKSAYV